MRFAAVVPLALVALALTSCGESQADLQRANEAGQAAGEAKAAAEASAAAGAAAACVESMEAVAAQGGHGARIQERLERRDG